MKKTILIFFVASLFIGTTLAGASSIETDDDKKVQPLPAGSDPGPARVCGLIYNDHPLRRSKSFEVGETVTYGITIVWAGNDKTLEPPITLYLLNNGAPEEHIIYNPNSDTLTYHKLDHTYTEKNQYNVRVRWHDNSDPEIKNSVGLDALKTYIGTESHPRPATLNLFRIFFDRFPLLRQLISL